MPQNKSPCNGCDCREIWLIIYFLHSHSKEKYAIVNKNKLVESSWQSLGRGSLVVIIRNGRRTEAMVLSVSDDCDMLRANFNSYVKEFETDHGIRRKRIVLKCENATQTDPLPETLEPQDEIKNEDRSGATIELSVDNTPKQTTPTDYLAVNLRIQRNQEGNQGAQSNYITTAGKSKISSKASSSVSITSIATDGNPLSNGEQTEATRLHPAVLGDATNMVPIGTGSTKVNRLVLESINWKSHTASVRKLLMTVFDRTTLATHSLTGKPSPAFLNSGKQTKMQLDPVKVGDIVGLVSAKCNVPESLVRNAITTKCADENKMFRKRKNKENSGEQRHTRNSC